MHSWAYDWWHFMLISYSKSLIIILLFWSAHASLITIKLTGFYIISGFHFYQKFIRFFMMNIMQCCNCVLHTGTKLNILTTNSKTSFQSFMLVNKQLKLLMKCKQTAEIGMKVNCNKMKTNSWHFNLECKQTADIIT